jgi:hypothetical protein
MGVTQGHAVASSVIPAEAGIQAFSPAGILDPGVRRGDGTFFLTTTLNH